MTAEWFVILSNAKDLLLTFKATPDSSLALRMTPFFLSS